MKKTNVVTMFLLLVGAVLVLPLPAWSQQAQIPFNQNVTMAKPNILIYFDNSPSMNEVDNPTTDPRGRNEICMDVIAGRHDPVTYNSRQVYKPHYDLNTVGASWALHKAAEDAVIPRVIKMTFNGATSQFEPAAGGTYFMFYHPSDSGRLAALNTLGAVDNLAAFMRNLEPVNAAIDESLRWSAYYIIRDSTTATVRFSSTDVSNNRTIWHASNTSSGYYLSYYDALRRFYFYASTGNETSTTTDNRQIVPLKRVPGNSSYGNWPTPPRHPITAPYMPADGTGRNLCYRSGTQYYTCYKPVAYNDPSANRFLIFDDLTPTQQGAQDVVANVAFLNDWRNARTDVNKTATIYCKGEDRAVWGDDPYSTWYFNSSDNPISDRYPSSMGTQPIFGATISGATNMCDSSDPDAFSIGTPPPTDAAITTNLNGRLLQSTLVNANLGNTIDEFIIPTTTSTRIDNYLRARVGLNHAYWCSYFSQYQGSYACPAAPTWPGAISYNDPWYGGWFDHLYYDEAYINTVGIMSQFPNVNWGVAKFARNDCTDFPKDAAGNCYVTDMVFNLTVWGEFPRYRDTHSTTVLNQVIMDYLTAHRTSWLGSTNTPISSSLSSLWRYYYNAAMNWTAKSGTTSGHTSLDIGAVEDPRTDSAGADVNSMFFDMGFPTANGMTNDYGPTGGNHLIQCDPFYVNGCRRNYVIYLTDGANYQGETDANSSTTLPSTQAKLYRGKDNLVGTINPRTYNNSPWYVAGGVQAAKYKWIRALKDPSYIPPGYPTPPKCSVDGKTRGNDMNPWGVKLFVVAFPLNTWDAEFMAWASVMDYSDPDEINYMMLANNESALRDSLTAVMNSIMAGQFTRAAAEISESEFAVITSYFTVGGSYPLWKGNLLKYAIEDDGTVSGSTEYNVATTLKNTTIQPSRTLFTYLPNSGNRYDFVSSGVGSNNYIVDAFDPFHNLNFAWGNTVTVRQAKATLLVKFLRGDSDSTFTSGKAQTQKLGPIIHSKPTIVTKPMNQSYQSMPGYGEFMAANEDRPPIIYFGTGYGLLEAISLNDGVAPYTDLKGGEEIFGMVPTGILRYMNYNRMGMQIYGADGSPVVKDVRLYNNADPPVGTWNTVLMAGLAGGGTSYYALNITDVRNSADDVSLLWNFHDDNLGFTWSTPTIGPVSYIDSNDNNIFRWAAFFGGGMQKAPGDPTLEPDRANYFYILNMQDGSLLAKLELPDVSAITSFDTLSAGEAGPNYTVDSSVLNYNQVPGTPFVVDKDFDRDYDYAFIGDQEGRLWKIMFDPAYVEGGSNPEWKACLFYDTADVNFDGVVDSSDGATLDLAHRTPVFYAPDVTRSPSGELIVFFASGNAEFTSDNEPVLTYKVYAMIDPETIECSYAQPMPTTVGEETAVWPVSLEAKEKPITPMHVIGGKLMFKTFLATPQVACTRGVGRLWSLDYLTGQPYYPGPGYVEKTPEGNDIGTGDLDISLTKGVDVDPWGKPSIFNMTVLPAEPLSWGEGVAF